MIAIEIPKLNYSTIATARRVSIEMPYADARMGAPFKQKNGPAVAIAGAIGSISAGITAGGLLGGLMIAGGIASGLGALTGNETLMTIGSVASLASFGVGAFTGADGGFLNPFSSAADGSSNFFNSVSGKAIKGVFDGIKGGLGIETPAVSDTMAGNIAGGATQTVDAAANAGNLLSSGTEQLKYVDGVAQSGVGRITDAVGGAMDSVSSAASGILGSGASSGGLGGLLNNQGAMGLLSGLGDGYMKGKEIEQQQPLFDAKVDNINSTTAAQQQQMDLINQRQQNLQYQPNVGIGVNQDANVYNREPGQSNVGKYAVVLNGEVTYLDQAQYDQFRQAQAQPQQPQGGLLQQQGAVA